MRLDVRERKYADATPRCNIAARYAPVRGQSVFCLALRSALDQRAPPQSTMATLVIIFRIINTLMANSSGYPADLLATVRGALLGVQTLVSAGLSKAAWNLPGACAEGLVAYCRRV